jgi:hypothetical protein
LVWFNQASPQNPINLQGVIAGSSSALKLSVATQGVKSPANSNTLVYLVNIAFSPVAGQVSTLRFASSAKSSIAQVWG